MTTDMKRRLYLSGVLFVMFRIFAPSVNVQAEGHLELDSQSWPVRMAESVMSRHPRVYFGWDYVTGTVLRGFEELWRETGDSVYFDYIRSTVDDAVRSDGTIAEYNFEDYNIDEIKEGSLVLFLYKEIGEDKYRKAAELLRSQLADHPRTSDGGFWHKERYPWQMWLDGLYMGTPFYAGYGVVFDDPAALDDAVRQLVLMENHARDENTGLLYHGWNETKEQDWADPVTGCSPSFWGRAIGWYAMALVDVLDFLPSEHGDRDSVIAILQRLASAVADYQDDATGTWWQVVDKGGEENNYRECSVSCMLVYTLLKGIRKGYLDPDCFETAEKGFEGILQEFVVEKADGTLDLIQTCRTAGLGNGRDGTYNYYVNETDMSINDGKSVGPFICAGLEMEMHTTLVTASPEPARSIRLESSGCFDPFNRAVRLRIFLPERTDIQVRLYDVRGRTVMSLEKETADAGIRTIRFDASVLAAGSYICQLTTGTGSIAARLPVLP